MDLFLFEEKLRSTSNNDVDLFFIKKNSYLHPIKMQICFYFKEKNCSLADY